MGAKTKVWVIGIFLGTMLVFMLIRFFGPASWLAAMRGDQWSVEHATFIFDEEEPVVVLEVFSRGGYRAPDINAVHVVSLDSREVLGSYYHQGRSTVMGITRAHVWVAAKGEKLGLKRNDLTIDIELNELIAAKPEIADIVESVKVDGVEDMMRIAGLDGHQYMFDPKTSAVEKLPLDAAPLQPSLITFGRQSFGGTFRTPSTIDDELLLEKELLYDIKKQQLMLFANKDYLVSYKTLKGATGKCVIARISDDEHFVWKVTEADLFETQNEYGRALRISALHDGTLYCVMQEYDGDGSVYLVALNPDSGEVKWRFEL